MNMKNIMNRYGYKTWKDFFYHSGDIFLPSALSDLLDQDLLGSSKMRNKRYYYISGWSFMHLYSGLLFGYILYTYFGKYLNSKVSLESGNENDSDIIDIDMSVKSEYKREFWRYIVYLLILHTIWEIWQLWIGMSTLRRWIGSGGINDIFMDTLMFMSGGVLMYKYLESV
jgi:hypothetical protein